MNPVCPDQEIARHITDCRMRRYHLGALGETGDLSTGLNRIVRQPCTHGTQQQHLQFPAMHRVLRPAISSLDPPRFAEQQRSVGAVVTDRAGCRGDP